MNIDLAAELKKITGLPFRNAGRACDIVWFGFGNIIKKKDRRTGGVRDVAEYVFHVQCAWRITDFHKIIVGSADKYIPSSKIEVNSDFDWDVQGANRCDEQLKNLFSNLETELIVKNVAVDRLGSIRVFFTDEVILEIIPDSSTDIESWRFFQNGADKEHLVVNGIGLNWE